MNYDGLIRSLELPTGHSPAHELHYEDLTARALTRDDLAADLQGVNESVDLIQRTRGGTWPTGPITEEFDYADLVWHEVEFRDGTSFAYAVYDAGGRYLGCCYLYPMGRRTPLDETLVEHDVDVSWWVTPDAYERGYYVKLHRALQHWVAEDFGWQKPYFSNREIPGD